MREKNLIFLTLLLLTVLTACHSAQSTQIIGEVEITPDKEPVMELSLAHTAKDDRHLLQMAEEIADRTDDYINIKIYPDGQMGTDEEIINAVRRGSLSMAYIGTAAYQDVVPEVSVMSIPACFDEYIQPEIIYSEAFVEILNKNHRENGLELVGLNSGSWRVLSSSEAVNGVADLQGLQIRVMNNPFYVQFWDTLGVSAETDILFQDLYRASQEGIIQAQENNYPEILSSKLYEVQPYILDGSFFVSGMALVFNSDVWENIPQGYREIIREETTEAFARYNVSEHKAYNLVAQQATVTLMSHEDMELLRLYSWPILEEIRLQAGDEVLQALQKETARVPDAD